MKLFKILLLVILPFSVWAEPTSWIEIHLASHHTSADAFWTEEERLPLNVKNYGIGFTAPINNHEYFSYTFGGFENSYYTTSLYGGVDMHGAHTPGFNGGLILGILSGYGEYSTSSTSTADSKRFGSDGAIIPMMLPYIAYRYKMINAKVGAFPTGGVDGLTLTFSIGIALR